MFNATVIESDSQTLFRAISLSEKLTVNGKLKALHAKEYDEIDHGLLRIWCHLFGRYGLPTAELVDWLLAFIGQKTAIEIGAGCGDLGSKLNIPMTDNHCQTWPDVVMMYQSMNQPMISYGADVENIDALNAVQKYDPQIVIGSWVTQWIDPNLPPPPGGGSIYGVKEEEIVKMGKTYVVIGAEEIHGKKKLLQYPHKVIDAPFVRSRRKDNKIWIWNG